MDDIVSFDFQSIHSYLILQPASQKIFIYKISACIVMNVMYDFYFQSFFPTNLIVMEKK